MKPVWLFALLVYLLFILYMIATSSPAKSAGWRLSEAECTQVRAGVAVFGIERAVQWARERGYTSVQIMRARQCLTRRGT